jgi:hypothetical protein
MSSSKLTSIGKVARAAIRHQTLRLAPPEQIKRPVGRGLITQNHRSKPNDRLRSGFYASVNTDNAGGAHILIDPRKHKPNLPPAQTIQARGGMLDFAFNAIGGLFGVRKATRIPTAAPARTNITLDWNQLQPGVAVDMDLALIRDIQLKRAISEVVDAITAQTQTRPHSEATKSIVSDIRTVTTEIAGEFILDLKNVTDLSEDQKKLFLLTIGPTLEKIAREDPAHAITHVQMVYDPEILADHQAIEKLIHDTLQEILGKFGLTLPDSPEGLLDRLDFKIADPGNLFFIDIARLKLKTRAITEAVACDFENLFPIIKTGDTPAPSITRLLTGADTEIATTNFLLNLERFPLSLTVNLPGKITDAAIFPEGYSDLIELMREAVAYAVKKTMPKKEKMPGIVSKIVGQIKWGRTPEGRLIANVSRVEFLKTQDEKLRFLHFMAGIFSIHGESGKKPS